MAQVSLLSLSFSLSRYFWEESGPFCPGVHDSLPGPAHVLHLTLQHHHEGEVVMIPPHYQNL